MANLQTRKRDSHELVDDTIPPSKRSPLETDHDQPHSMRGPHAEYLESKNAAYPKAVVEALDSKLAETDQTTSDSAALPTLPAVCVVLLNKGQGVSRYAPEAQISVVGLHRSVVSANCNALSRFDGTVVDYSEEDEDEDDDPGRFVPVRSGPFRPESGQVGWWIEADACLHLCAGDDWDGDTEVWVQKRSLED